MLDAGDAGARSGVVLRFGQAFFIGHARAIELARQARAALVDKDDVARGAHPAKGIVEQDQDVGAGLAGSAGQHEQRVGTGRLAKGGGDRHVQVEGGAARLAVVEGDRQAQAAQYFLRTGQVAAAALLGDGLGAHAAGQQGKQCSTQ